MTHPAILEAEPPPVDLVEPYTAYGYTTHMEMEWLSDLTRRHQWELLRKLQVVYRLRHWEGRGMAVDGGRVQAHLGMLLAREPR